MESLDKLRRKRSLVRASITRTVNELEGELTKTDQDFDLLQAKSKRLEALVEEVTSWDLKILDVMFDQDAEEDDCLKESMGIDSYKDKVQLVQCKVARKTVLEDPLRPPSENGSGGNASRKAYKLPKLELKKFNGELTEWLGFWSQFDKIDQDENLHASDKFQYLLQSMVVGTRARELVESYPLTSDNYPKVVKALKQRFGRPKMLKQVYVRELLKMVIINAKANEKIKLSTMYDKLESHLRALESLGVTVDQSSEFLYPMVESSLPGEILTAWQRCPNYNKDGSKEEPPQSEMDYLMSFLEREVESEEQWHLAKTGFSDEAHKPEKFSGANKAAPKFRRKEDIPTVAGLHIGDKSSACVFCDRGHPSQSCFKANVIPLQEKSKMIRDKGACFLCLKPGHRARGCPAQVKCNACAGPHYKVMCPGQQSSSTEMVREFRPNRNQDRDIGPQMASINFNVAMRKNTILLKVLTVRIGRSAVLRVLIDDGSQVSFVRSSAARSALCKVVGERSLRTSAFGSMAGDPKVHPVFEMNVESMDRRVRRLMYLPAVDHINSDVPRIPDGPWIQQLKMKNIWLSDFCSDSGDIDILIGADLMNQFETGRKVRLSNGLDAIEYVFGWTLRGPVPHEPSAALAVTSMAVTDASLSQLWSLELLGIQDPATHKSKEEKEEDAKKHFLQNVKRDETGRYSVDLPWVGGTQKIPDNKLVAEKRLLSTTTKLRRDGMYEDYDKIFQGWLDEGIIEKVSGGESETCHYLPHRAVYKPESVTTPVRPVFDASCKTGRNPSLNDCLEKGPNLIEMLPTIMLRFRMGKVGVVSDIRKAFQMIEVGEKDRDFLRFLWWDKSGQNIGEFRHRRVVFGVNCSPFLLGAVIENHLDHVKEEDRKLAKKLLKSLYVDNCVTAVEDNHEFEDFKERATSIMMNAGMELRQWERSAGEESGVGPASGCGLDYVSGSNSITSVLGMRWSKVEDSLSCVVDPEVPDVWTKRSLLSFVQKIFDPMGYLCPALIIPKILLQRACLLELKWDEELTQNEVKPLMGWIEGLSNLEKIWIPRNVGGDRGESDSLQLHMFCDASQQAYAAVVFLRVEVNGRVDVHLLQAKSRVAPLQKTKIIKKEIKVVKVISIPRLELLGCIIGARLTKSVMKAMELDIPTFYWSDSSTALAWIRRNDEWGTFVGNRVREICQLSRTEEWRHVPGLKNPADLPSRGCTPQELLASRWWTGPEWLRSPMEQWPSEKPSEIEEEIEAERKKGCVMSIQCSSVIPLNLPFATFKRNVQFVAGVRRLVQILRLKKSNNGPLTVMEMEEAEMKIWRIVQQECFGKSGNSVNGLSVVQDKDRLLRLKTKVVNREDSDDFRLPLLLPKKHPIMEQLIMQEHLDNAHGGVQYLMSKLRERYWIVQTRRTIQRVLKGCRRCQRYKSKAPIVDVAPLPADRIKAAKVFEVTGVDLAGPLFLKDGSKTWIVLFTCGVFRAVHLELVKSLNTDSFLLALIRFVSRRGRPAIIFSDNGTNFVGAENLFRDLDWKRIQHETMLQRIQWKFNPPTAAWWGGFWERLIQTVKGLLLRMLGHRKLNYYQLMTSLCQVEAVVNARPLTYVTEDGDDLVPLTPAMFLQDLSETRCPEEAALGADGLRKKYREMTQLKDELRDRFRSEYLGLLIQKKNPKKIRVELKVGDVVLVGSEGRKRLDWPLARIVELIQGKDGHTRVAKVKTAIGFLLRPIQRLFPMEMSVGPEMVEVSDEVKKRARVAMKTMESPVDQDVVLRSGRRVRK